MEQKETRIKELSINKNIDKSVSNMANAILYMTDYLEYKIIKDPSFISNFFKFFRNKIILIYVSSQSLDDAFRMFTILNNRGVKLRNADILKADNLSAIQENKIQEQYAQTWEEIENYFSDEFDSFLSHLQSILVKQKASLSLLKEFELNIFEKRILK